MTRELKYVDNDKELLTESYLSKKELKEFFGSGKIKLQTTYFHTKWGKPHNANGSPWIKYRFQRTKSKVIWLY